MEMSPSGETGREDKEGGCPPCEGAAQMCGAQVWVRACGSGSEEKSLSVTLWWDVLQTTDHGKEVDGAFSEQPEEVPVS